MNEQQKDHKQKEQAFHADSDFQDFLEVSYQLTLYLCYLYEADHFKHPNNFIDLAYPKEPR